MPQSRRSHAFTKKSVLRLPELEQAKSAVLNSLTAVGSQRSYRHAIDAWTSTAQIAEGRIFRSINKPGRVWGEGVTPKVIWQVVKAAAGRADIQALAPHDLRRYAAWRTMPSRPAYALWYQRFPL